MRFLRAAMTRRRQSFGIQVKSASLVPSILRDFFSDGLRIVQAAACMGWSMFMTFYNLTSSERTRAASQLERGCNFPDEPVFVKMAEISQCFLGWEMSATNKETGVVRELPSLDVQFGEPCCAHHCLKL